MNSVRIASGTVTLIALVLLGACGSDQALRPLATDAGVPGEVAATGLSRLPGLLQQHQPDLVVLIHGGNDMLRRQNRSHAADNLRSMIGLARDSGADVVLLGVPQPALILRTATFYTDVAESTGTPLDGDVLADILQYTSNKSDPVHPNSRGCRMLAEAV